MESITSLDSVAPSDFKDLLDAALKLHAESTCFLQETRFFSTATKEDLDQSTNKRLLTTHLVKVAKALVKRHEDLNTHYGWVLASDRSCVDKALRSVCTADGEPREWFTGMVKNLEVFYIASKHVVNIYEDFLS
ncbi:uncharacterized protein SETTUDRAFT_33087 [Exserohilum turcica Et28A]|uniref:Uncharacterized protein n=1 Tax=Exserohilum turcicum (strain 28A) TaxID=671987 RepID=R0JSM8_EXST2|nr:uncharacterized protein SETTUDRAFT_33087 [Exserohilum turcica Et28A]EOA84083.1 hypothetical protein SETTUDRAFT_33087 [Exserohilum turcica Et28A]